MTVKPPLTRRTLLKLASFTTLPVLLPVAATASTPNNWLNPTVHRVIAAAGRNGKEYGMALVSEAGNQSHLTHSGFRGHDVTLDEHRNRLIMFARRPGTRCLVVDATSGETITTFDAKANHHFFGHGCFSEDGKQLFTSEADFETGQGKIGIRDAQTYQQTGELPSHGIGPHQIKLLPGQPVLAIANGGLLTHPASGRTVLNLDTMQPNLSFVNATSGGLIRQHTLAEPKNSIRHLDVAADGTVAVAMQLQREACQHNNAVPLVAVCKPGGDLMPLEAPGALLSQFDDYMGSVVIHHQNRSLVVTSPRGNVAAFWNIESGEFLNYHALFDVCGAAVSHDQEHFILTNSRGDMRFINAQTLKEDPARRQRLPGIHFDNHLTIV